MPRETHTHEASRLHGVFIARQWPDSNQARGRCRRVARFTDHACRRDARAADPGGVGERSGGVPDGGGRDGAGALPDRYGWLRVLPDSGVGPDDAGQPARVRRSQKVAVLRRPWRHRHRAPAVHQQRQDVGADPGGPLRHPGRFPMWTGRSARPRPRWHSSPTDACTRPAQRDHRRRPPGHGASSASSARHCPPPNWTRCAKATPIWAP